MTLVLIRTNAFGDRGPDFLIPNNANWLSPYAQSWILGHPECSLNVLMPFPCRTTQLLRTTG